MSWIWCFPVRTLKSQSPDKRKYQSIHIFFFWQGTTHIFKNKYIYYITFFCSCKATVVFLRTRTKPSSCFYYIKMGTIAPIFRPFPSSVPPEITLKENIPQFQAIFTPIPQINSDFWQEQRNWQWIKTKRNSVCPRGLHPHSLTVYRSDRCLNPHDATRLASTATLPCSPPYSRAIGQLNAPTRASRGVNHFLCLVADTRARTHARTYLPCQSLFLLRSVDLANYRPYLWVRIMRLHTEQILSCLCNEIWVELRCRCGRGGGQTHSRSWHVICSPSLRLTFQEIAFQWRREQRSQSQRHTHSRRHTYYLSLSLPLSLSVLWQAFWFMAPIPWCRCSPHS